MQGPVPEVDSKLEPVPVAVAVPEVEPRTHLRGNPGVVVHMELAPDMELVAHRVVPDTHLVPADTAAAAAVADMELDTELVAEDIPLGSGAAVAAVAVVELAGS